MLKETELRDFGSELRRMRKEMGMSMETLAAELGTDYRVISRYENGQAEMGALMYRRLLQLHDQKMKSNELLQQIQKLSSTDQVMVEMIIARMSAS